MGQPWLQFSETVLTIKKYILIYNRCRATVWLWSRKALLCLVLWFNFGLKLVTGGKCHSRPGNYGIIIISFT